MNAKRGLGAPGVIGGDEWPHGRRVRESGGRGCGDDGLARPGESPRFESTAFSCSLPFACACAAGRRAAGRTPATHAHCLPYLSSPQSSCTRTPYAHAHEGGALSDALQIRSDLHLGGGIAYAGHARQLRHDSAPTAEQGKPATHTRATLIPLQGIRGQRGPTQARRGALGNQAGLACENRAAFMLDCKTENVADKNLPGSLTSHRGSVRAEDHGRACPRSPPIRPVLVSTRVDVGVYPGRRRCLPG